MVKRFNIVKLITLLISLVLCSVVIFKGISSSSEAYLFFYFGALVLATAMFMIYKKPYIENNKAVYETFMVVFFVASIFIISLLMYLYINSSFMSIITYDYEVNAIFSVVLYLAFIFLNIFLCIDGLKKESNKINDILILVTTVVAILEFVICSIYGGNDTFRLMFGDGKSKSIYIVQNYIYFAIMYAFTYIHGLLNRVV